MFNTASGVRIPFPDKIEEKYVFNGNWIDFNISFEKLKPFFNDFLANICGPLFLFIHLPLIEKEENALRENDVEHFHEEVLYLDGQTKNQIFEIMEQYGELLLNDGISQFGVGSHKNGDELFIQKYKTACLYSKNIKQYVQLMDKYEISETSHLVTAWDTFSPEHSGERSKITIDNKDVYDVVELLKNKGMYRAKIVED